MSQFAGIDIGLGHTYSCILDTTSGSFIYPDDRMNLEETINWLRQFKELSAGCVDGPPNPNTGRLAELLPDDTRHNVDRRVTEFQIGIGGCYSTRSVLPQPGATNYWMQSAFNLFQLLSAEFGWSIDKGGPAGQLIETHPTYAFKALLGCNRYDVDGIERLRLDPQVVLRRKHSPAGRQQRIELLTALCDEIGLEIGDSLRQKWNQRIDWVDAAICAFIAYWQQAGHVELESPGDPAEGAIFLRVSAEPFSVTAHGVHAGNVQGQPAIPQRPMNGVPTPANAIILRLGETIELSQLDTIDTILSSADLEDFWLPCGSKAMPGLGGNLNLVAGRLFLAFGANLRIALNVSECLQSETPLAYPVGNDNPWPFEDCYCWLRVCESAEINTDHFYTNRRGEWAQGFGAGQTALLWAVIPYAGGQN